MRSWFQSIGRTAPLLGLLGLAACQPRPIGLTQPDPIPVNGTGYVLVNAPIQPQTRDLLVRDIDKLVTAGAKDIHLGINSPGGSIDAAQDIVTYMARLHSEKGVTFEAYNVGMVASAATYIFLNAQQRFSTERGTFLFHAAGMTATGAVPAQRLREAADKLDAYERTMRTTLRTRTKLTDGEALTYVRRTVVLNSDDARRDGVIDGISAFSVPNSARAWVITVIPPATNGAAVQPAGMPH